MVLICKQQCRHWQPFSPCRRTWLALCSIPSSNRKRLPTPLWSTSTSLTTVWSKEVWRLWTTCRCCSPSRTRQRGTIDRCPNQLWRASTPILRRMSFNRRVLLFGRESWVPVPYFELQTSWGTTETWPSQAPLRVSSRILILFWVMVGPTIGFCTYYFVLTSRPVPITMYYHYRMCKIQMSTCVARRTDYWQFNY